MFPGKILKARCNRYRAILAIVVIERGMELGAFFQSYFDGSGEIGCAAVDKCAAHHRGDRGSFLTTKSSGLAVALILASVHVIVIEAAVLSSQFLAFLVDFHAYVKY